MYLLNQAALWPKGFDDVQSPDGKAVIVSAATPIWFDNKVVGVVIVEETTNNI